MSLDPKRSLIPLPFSINPPRVSGIQGKKTNNEQNGREMWRFQPRGFEGERGVKSPMI